MRLSTHPGVRDARRESHQLSSCVSTPPSGRPLSTASKTESFEIEELTVGDVAAAIEGALTSAGFAGGISPEASVEAGASTERGVRQKVERPASDLGDAMIYDVDVVDASRPLDGADHIRALRTGQYSRIHVEPHTPWWSEGPSAPYLKVWVTAPSADIVTSLLDTGSTALRLERADLEADEKAMTRSTPAETMAPKKAAALREIATSPAQTSFVKIIAVLLALAAAFALGAILF